METESRGAKVHKKRIRQKIGKRERLKAIAGARVAIFPIMGAMAAQSAAMLSRVASAVGIHPIVKTAQLALAQASGMAAMVKAHSKGKEWVEFAEAQSFDYYYRKKFNFPVKKGVGNGSLVS